MSKVKRRFSSHNTQTYRQLNYQIIRFRLLGHVQRRMFFPSLEAIFVQEWNFCRFSENGKSRPNPPPNREKCPLSWAKSAQKGEMFNKLHRERISFFIVLSVDQLALCCPKSPQMHFFSQISKKNRIFRTRFRFSWVLFYI